MLLSNIHEHYDQLTEIERAALDDGFFLLTAHLQNCGVSFHAGDLIERSVDAAAAAIIARRPNQTKGE